MSLSVNVISLFRALLEDLAHGPGPVCSPVRCHDSGQHLPGGLRLQERKVRSQAQVRRTDVPAAVSSVGSEWRTQRDVLMGINYNFFLFFPPESADDPLFLRRVTGLPRNERMPFLRR